eukprot:SAG22_NODE_17674_length_300_cov_1.278607_1_plen_63_part_10
MRDDTSPKNSLGVWSGAPPIMFYVMPHLGNTAASWRRQFYGACVLDNQLPLGLIIMFSLLVFK